VPVWASIDSCSACVFSGRQQMCPFIHSYSFNVEVDITQLQTEKKERKTELFIYVAVSSN